METTTQSRNLTVTDYSGIADYYARLALAEHMGELQANMAPRPERLAEIAREMLTKEGVLADPSVVAGVLRYHIEDGVTYPFQSVTDRAMNHLVADVTLWALAE